MKSESEVSQSCPTLCYPMDCSLLGSSVHGVFQARVLEWGAISFSRRSSRPRDWTQVSHIVGRCFVVWATREVSNTEGGVKKKKMGWKIHSERKIVLGKAFLQWMKYKIWSRKKNLIVNFKPYWLDFYNTHSGYNYLL